MKQAKYTDYQIFSEVRSDLESDGYTVKSHADFGDNIFTLEIERTSLVPDKLLDPTEFKQERRNG